MKHYLSIILLVLLSGTAFGQDTLLLKLMATLSPTESLDYGNRLAAEKACRDYAFVFTDTVSVMRQAE